MKKYRLGVVTVVALTITTLMVFLWAPLESSMGIIQKIMYIHVPSAWTGFLAFFIAFVSSVLYLWKRQDKFDIYAGCSVEIGTLFCGFSLITGSIWARPTWNTYWTWDARLTTTLILFLIFCGYLLLRKFTEYGEQRARLSAVIVILGFLDIPLIHLSVTWWRTLHQPSTVFSAQKDVIDRPLVIMLWIALFSFTVLFGYLLSTRIKLEKSERDYLRKIANLG